MMDSTLKGAKHLLRTSPLSAFDQVLNYLHAASEAPQSDQSCEALRLLCHAMLTSREVEVADNDPLEIVFDKEVVQGSSRRFCAFCILRIFHARDNWRNGEARTWFYKAESLLDEEFGDNLYRELGITQKSQTYQKIRALVDYVGKIEDSVGEASKSLGDFDSINTFRQEFTRKVRPNINKLFDSFLSRESVFTRLDDVFNTLERYVDADPAKQYGAFIEARDTLESFVRDAEAHGTNYSKLYLAETGKALNTLLTVHFSSMPCSKPGLIEVFEAEKKYPFHLVGKSFPVVFALRNAGTGHAFDVTLSIQDATDVEFQKMETYLGTLEPGTVLEAISFPITVIASSKSIVVEGSVNWKNHDGTIQTCSFGLELHRQSTDIAWETLKNEYPYDLEPVMTEQDLVGRTEILNGLTASVSGKTVRSSFVFGQKRVGKTSVAKALMSRLKANNPKLWLVIYKEGGDYVHQDATATVERLGTTLCASIRAGDSRLSHLETPSFSGALSSIADFLDTAISIAPERRILVILDEFDELPIGLYKHGSVADTFFLTLRSLSARTQVGFVLIGSEKMNLILNCQGDALNKFVPIPIDYFDKETNWSDYEELVRKPVEGILEFTDRAVNFLFEQTAGNPYFTKLICKNLFDAMVNKRDSHVTVREVEEAIHSSLIETSSNSFSHFWEDYILESGSRAEEVSITRRKVLLALAEVLRKKEATKRDRIAEMGKSYDLTPQQTVSEILLFEQRRVLRADESGCFHCVVPFFERWLIDKGVREIITSFTDTDALWETKKRDEELRIKAEEIVRLTKRFGVYLGRTINEENVRAWLEQFGDAESQRLMFRILQHLRFYPGDVIRAKLKESFSIVARGLVRVTEEGKRKRSHILVSYLDKVGKSGAQCAKLFADENEIYADNVIEKSKLRKTLEERDDIQAIVFVDDFIGSGSSASEYLEEVCRDSGEIWKARSIRVYFLAICGYNEGKKLVEERLSKLEMSDVVHVYVCDPLDDTAKCFFDRSSIFPDPIDREKAMRIAQAHGSKLERKQPLGYGNCQAAVVFENACPNNSLPILWKEKEDWVPLFKRI